MGIERAARAVLLAALVSACTVGPDFEQPSLWSPGSWFQSRAKPAPATSLPVPEPIDPKWWAKFNDPILTKLVERVAASNLDVRAATLRFAESRAQRSIAGADQFPLANGNASYTRERQSERGVVSLFSGGNFGGNSNGGSGSGGANTPGAGENGLAGRRSGIPGISVQPFNLFQYGFDASWEIDFWGRVRREVESADASVDASTEARRNTLLSVMAEVARDYIELRGVQRTLQITRENLDFAKQSAALASERARGGLGTDLDTANAEAQVAVNASQLPQFEQQEALLMNQLALLLGQTPGALRSDLAQARPVPPVPPRVPVGLPSELARRRPDIRQAEALLHAATADIGVAQADFFPRVTLSGSLALQALQFKDLGNWGARTYGLGPSISLPIFEGGRLRSTLELRKAQQQEAAISYQRTVLQAFHDVDNALTAYAAEQRRRASLQTAVEQNRRALLLATQQYRQGLSDYLNVLTAQRGLLAAEQQWADSTTTISTNLVQLYKALGGGWESAFPQAKLRKG